MLKRVLFGIFVYRRMRSENFELFFRWDICFLGVFVRCRIVGAGVDGLEVEFFGR